MRTTKIELATYCWSCWGKLEGKFDVIEEREDGKELGERGIVSGPGVGWNHHLAQFKFKLFTTCPNYTKHLAIVMLL